MSNVLITGCDKGIGLGLVREFLKTSDIHHVIATGLHPKHDDVSFFSHSKGGSYPPVRLKGQVTVDKGWG